MDLSPTLSATLATSTNSQLSFSTSATAPSTSDLLQLVALSIVGIISTVANLLVILTILMTRKLRSTPSSVLVTNLAFADVALTSWTVPIAACGLMSQRWMFSQAVCLLTSAMSSTFSAASALSVAAIAMDRYLAILYCLRYSVWPRWRYVLIVLTCVWLPALFFGFLLFTRAATVGYSPDLYVCDVMAARSVAYVWSRALVVFCFPLALLVFAYARIIHVARVHSRKIDVVVPHGGKSSNENGGRRVDAVNPSGAVAAGAMFSVRRLSIISIPGRVEGGRQQFRISGDVELVATSADLDQGETTHSPQRRSCASFKLILLVLVFALCCGFYVTVHLLHVEEVQSSETGKRDSATDHPNATVKSGTGYDDSISGEKEKHRALTAGLWMLMINSMLNPFLYAISSHRFRYFAERLLSKHHSNAEGGVCVQGGNLFDVSIYSAFLRNLQAPTSRHSSGDSGDLAHQQLPLTTLREPRIRRDSNSSAGTSSTLVDSKKSSPMSTRKESKTGSSQFLQVPHGLAGSDDDGLSGTSGTSTPVEDASSVVLRESDVTVHKPHSPVIQPVPLCGDCSQYFSECTCGSESLRTGRSGSGTSSLDMQDDFVFSANNIARIRIVLDLV